MRLRIFCIAAPQQHGHCKTCLSLNGIVTELGATLSTWCCSVIKRLLLCGRQQKTQRVSPGVSLAQEITINATLVNRHPEIMSRALCFTGTRVPVKNLFDYLEGASSLEKNATGVWFHGDLIVCFWQKGGLAQGSWPALSRVICCA